MNILSKTARTCTILIFTIMTLPAFSQIKIIGWGLETGFELPTGSITESFNGLNYEQLSNFQLGMQIRLGHIVYGGSGLRYYINKQTWTRSDTNADLNHDCLGIPLQMGISVINSRLFKLRLTLGVEYRFLVWISPNDLNIKINNKELNRNYIDFTGGLGFDFRKITLDAYYQQNMSSVIKNSNSKTGHLWGTIGFLF